MKVIILGGGMLAQELLESSPAWADIRQLRRDMLDITDAEAVSSQLTSEKVDAVINAAAYTQVDLAEEQAEQAYLVNRDGVRNIARACAENNYRLIHVSTDFVFRGDQSKPYRSHDKKNPEGVYAKSKSEGEDEVIREMSENWSIVRTSWVYSVYCSNFVKTMLRLMQERDELGVVNDQIGSPTWANALANYLWWLVGTEDCGIYHWCDRGETNWFEFANEIKAQALQQGLIDTEVIIKPVSSQGFAARAPRPAYSVLSCDDVGEGAPQRDDWQANLHRVLLRLKS